MKRLGARFALVAVVGLALLAGLALFLSPALRWRASVVGLKATGELRELWSSSLGGRIIAPPVTFEVNGRQMVTIAAGQTLFTFSLP